MIIDVPSQKGPMVVQGNTTGDVIRVDSNSASLKFCYSSTRPQFDLDSGILLRWKIGFTVQGKITDLFYVSSPTRSGVVVVHQTARDRL